MEGETMKMASKTFCEKQESTFEIPGISQGGKTVGSGG